MVEHVFLSDKCEVTGDFQGHCDFGTRGCRHYHLGDVEVPAEVPSSWVIDECLEQLLSKAWETGQAFNAGRPSNDMWLAPNAYKATTSYHAIEIIQALRAEIDKLQEQLKNSSN